MEALFTSTAIVALAEIGDKTQLLAILLATRFRQPLPIILGILVATLANHALAALLGASAAAFLASPVFRYAIGASFIAMAAWTLIPDKIDDEETGGKFRLGVLGTTIVAFFLAEMGDKTQIATVALAARFNDLWMVVAGTTFGMMIANVPAVLVGDKLAHKLPVRLVHGIAAIIFAVLGVLTLLGAGESLGF